LTLWDTILKELNSCSTSQAIPHNFWNPKFITLYKRPSPLPILNQMNQVQILTPNFYQIHFNIILPPVSRSYKASVTTDFPTEILYVFCITPNYWFLYLTTLISFDKKYKLWSRFTQSPKHVIMKQYPLPLQSVTSNIGSPIVIRWIIPNFFLTNRNF